MNLITRHVRPKPAAGVGLETLGKLNAHVRAGREDQASKERNTAATLMVGLSRSGSRAPIAFS